MAENKRRGCSRLLRWNDGVLEIIVLVTCLVCVAYVYSPLWNGAHALQFGDHISEKLVDEPFREQLTFRDVATVDEFWEYVESSAFLGELYSGAHDASAHIIPFGRSSLDVGASLLVGPVRFRQLRLRQVACPNSIRMKTHLGNCLDESDPYSPNRWSRAAFGPNATYTYQGGTEQCNKDGRKSGENRASSVIDKLRCNRAIWGGVVVPGAQSWNNRYPIQMGHSVLLPLATGDPTAQLVAARQLQQLRRDSWISTRNGTR